MHRKKNSLSGILKRQKSIVTKIHNPDGTTETRRERNPVYQWNLFNPIIRTFLEIRQKQRNKQWKSCVIKPFWVEQNDGAFLAVSAETGKIIANGNSFHDVCKKLGLPRHTDDPEPEIKYALMDKPRPKGELFVPSFEHEERSPPYRRG